MAPSVPSFCRVPGRDKQQPWAETNDRKNGNTQRPIRHGSDAACVVGHQNTEVPSEILDQFVRDGSLSHEELRELPSNIFASFSAAV